MVCMVLTVHYFLEYILELRLQNTVFLREVVFRALAIANTYVRDPVHNYGNAVCVISLTIWFSLLILRKCFFVRLI